jgi:hypothetical protein
LALIGTGLLITLKLPSSQDEMLDNGLEDLLQQKPFFVVYGKVSQKLDRFYAFLTLVKNDLITLMMMAIIFCHICSSTIIIFCGIKMVRFVAAHAMTEHLKELNRQLSRSLILLVFIF